MAVNFYQPVEKRYLGRVEDGRIVDDPRGFLEEVLQYEDDWSDEYLLWRFQSLGLVALPA